MADLALVVTNNDVVIVRVEHLATGEISALLMRSARDFALLHDVGGIAG